MLPDGETIVASLQSTLATSPQAAANPTPAVAHGLDQLLCQYGWEGLNALYEAVEDPFLDIMF